MAQIKIYGLKASLSENGKALSLAIHSAVIEALAYPKEKKFHRFLTLDKNEFIYPSDRSENYTIIEVSIFEGRSVTIKKQLINLIYQYIYRDVGIKPHDVEITIFETPKHNWGIRGKPGDELSLDYNIDVQPNKHM